MNIVISAEKRTDKQGRYAVRLSVCFMRRRFSSTLGHNMSGEQIQALRSDFNHEPYRKRDAHPLHKDLLKMLRDFKDALDWEEQKVVRGEQKAENINFASILNKVKGRATRQKEDEQPTPFSFWIEFVAAEQRRHDLVPSTVRSLQCFNNRLKTYNPNVTLAELATVDGVTRFIEWCIKSGMNNRTAKNQHAYLRWFLRWCYRKGYCGNDFERYRFDLKTASKRESLVMFLTMDELEAVAALELEGAMALTRDIFLFQCYTGLRHSDVMALRKSDIEDGVMRIFVKKTGTYLENKLNRFAMGIVERYINTPGDTLFPFYNMNSTELNLKTIGKMAGLTQQVRKVDYRNHEKKEQLYEKWELMTTHVGRKTFVVNSLDMGLTATQVISYTGHSSIQAMEPYISISRKKKDEAMNVWNTHGSSDDTDELKRRIAELTAQIENLQSDKQPQDAE